MNRTNLFQDTHSILKDRYQPLNADPFPMELRFAYVNESSVRNNLPSIRNRLAPNNVGAWQNSMIVTGTLESVQDLPREIVGGRDVAERLVVQSQHWWV